MRVRARTVTVTAGDESRELIVAGLKRSYAEGRISTGELERRLAWVLNARSAGESVLAGGLAPAMPVARGLTARLVRRTQRFALRLHGLFFASVVAGSLAIWELAGAGTFWPGLILVPAGALFAVHLYASHRVSAALERRKWDL